MAGWVNIPLTAGDDEWADATTWAELFGAWNERRAVIGDSPVAAPASGEVINSHALIEQMQDWVEAECSHFQCNYDLSGTIMTDPDGQPLAAWRVWSFSLLEDYVLPSEGWRRKKATGVEAGQMATDYYASYAELMNDLRLVFNALIWTSLTGTQTGLYGEKKEGNASSSVDLATAKTNAESDFASDTPVNTQNEVASYSVVLSGGIYYADIIRGTEKHKFSWAASPGVADIEYYIFTESPPDLGGTSEYDNNGENYVEDELTLQTTTDSTTAGAGDVTRTFGDTGLTLPIEPTAAPRAVRGYVANNHLALARWDTEFTYY